MVPLIVIFETHCEYYLLRVVLHFVYVFSNKNRKICLCKIIYIEKPYACIFTISRSCGIDSKALDRYIITAATICSCQVIVSNFQSRILTGKKHRQIKLQRLEKVRIWAFGLLVHYL